MCRLEVYNSLQLKCSFVLSFFYLIKNSFVLFSIDLFLFVADLLLNLCIRFVTSIGRGNTHIAWIRFRFNVVIGRVGVFCAWK
jgi:hypothetical protein